VTETVALSVPEVAVPKTLGEHPDGIADSRSVVNKLRAMKRGPVVGIAVIAMIVVALVSAGLAFGGNANDTASINPTTRTTSKVQTPSAPSADVSAAPTLSATGLCVDTVMNHLRVNYVDMAANTTRNTDADIASWLAAGASATPEWLIYSDNNFTASLGVLVGNRSPDEQLKQVAEPVSIGCVKAHGGAMSEAVDGLLASGVYEAPSSTVTPETATPKNPSTPAITVNTHSAGAERVTRQLPPLPKYWVGGDGTASLYNTLFASCSQAMLDAVPRIASGHGASVRADYASTPNLLYWLEVVASSAPKGSAEGALKWMNAPDPTGNTDGEKEGVGQACVGWAMSP
jgi:hypothetical protein